MNVHLLAVPGLPEIRAGDDLAAALLTALMAAELPLRDGDIVAISSKVVSKAEGRLFPAPDGAARDAVIAAQTVRVVAERVTPHGLARVVQSASGPVLAAAGVDASNVPVGQVLALPADPDNSARRLRAALSAASGARLGVLVTDTLGRPWRLGQTDVAIGAAGVQPMQDLTGRPDAGGRIMEVTQRAIADELAAAADLVKGKVTGVPVAVLRGLGEWVSADDGPGAAALLRPPAEDWFGHGHVEAVRAALGVPVGAVAPQPVSLGSTAERLARAVAVASSGPILPGALAVLVHEAGGNVTVVVRARSADGPEPATTTQQAIGALAQRLVAAAWTEGLTLELLPHPDGLLARNRSS